MTPLIASGMILNATLDTIAPIVTLSGSLSITITQNTPYTESGARWTDANDGS